MANVFARIALTKYHGLIGLNHRNLFLMVLETKKSKIKVLTGSVPDESPLPALQTAELYPHRKSEKASSLVSSLLRVLIPS